VKFQITFNLHSFEIVSITTTNNGVESTNELNGGKRNLNEGQNGRFLEAKAYPVEIDNVDSVRILYSTKEDVVSVPIKATIISSSSSFPVVAIA